MFKIWTDAGKNRLYINVGESNGTRMTAIVGEAERACHQLGSGFTCLIHFMRGNLLRAEDERLIFQLQNTLRSHGVQKTVYVRPEGSVLGRFQLEMLHIHGRRKSTLEQLVLRQLHAGRERPLGPVLVEIKATGVFFGAGGPMTARRFFPRTR